MSWQYRLVDEDPRGNPPLKTWEIFVVGSEEQEIVLATVYTERMAIDLVEGNKVIGAAIDLLENCEEDEYGDSIANADELETFIDTVLHYLGKVSLQ